jgi:hypothetical protein
VTRPRATWSGVLYLVGYFSYPKFRIYRGMRLTTHLSLVPRLRMNVACHCYHVFQSSRAVTGLIFIYTCMQVSYGLAS